MSSKIDMEDLKKQWNYPQLSLSARLVSGITLLIAELIGITGNIFVLILIVRILKRRQNLPNILIFMLSIIDLIGLPLTYSQAIISHMTGRYIGGQIACNYHATAITFCKYLSNILIALICLDRFLAMSYPFCYKERIAFDENRKYKIALFLVLIVLCILILSLLPLFGLGRNVLHFPNSYCLFDMDYGKETSIILLSIHIAFLGSITLLVIASNIGVCIQAHRLIQKIKPSLQMSKREVNRQRTLSKLQKEKTGNLQKKLSPKQEEKLLKISISSVAVFTICWLPFLIRMCLAVSGHGFSQGFDFASARLASLHSVLTPWMYPLFRRQYSAGFWHLFRWFISKISFNLIKQPDTKLDDIVEARSLRKETLQCFSQRTRSPSKREMTMATEEIELPRLEIQESSNDEQDEKPNDESHKVRFLEEENANNEDDIKSTDDK